MSRLPRAVVCRPLSLEIPQSDFRRVRKNKFLEYFPYYSVSRILTNACIVDISLCL